MSDRYDIAIVGGGMIGASLAKALSGAGMRLALVEAVRAEAPAQPSYDDRAIALAFGTRRIFEGLGLWSDLSREVTAIRSIHVSDRGHFGASRFDYRAEGVEALGYVVTARQMGRVLLKSVNAARDVVSICPGRLSKLSQGGDFAGVVVETPGGPVKIAARLVVAADGARSAVRECLGIPSREWGYGQTAIVTNVSCAAPRKGVAYERFTDWGPLAMLPMGEDRYSMVWTVPDGAAPGVLAMTDQAFLGRLQERFGFRLGRFLRVGRRRSYPLRMVRSQEDVRPRVALIGNASHTLHPVAGQGFNLGMRDVAVLAETLLEGLRRGRDPGDLALLGTYSDRRRADQRLTLLATDGLARLFTNPFAPVRAARSLGLVLMDLSPALKHAFARHTMGLAGRLPRLAQGLPLVGPTAND